MEAEGGSVHGDRRDRHRAESIARVADLVSSANGPGVLYHGRLLEAAVADRYAFLHRSKLHGQGSGYRSDRDLGDEHWRSCPLCDQSPDGEIGLRSGAELLSRGSLPDQIGRHDLTMPGWA